MPKKVLVDCYINDNFGDDLFLHMLCNRYNNNKFYTIARKQNKKMFDPVCNLKYLSFDNQIINTLNLTQFYKKKLRNYINKIVDIHITIGGSLFMERSETINETVYNKFLSKIIRNKKNCLIGSNFGEYESQKFYDDYHAAFSLYDSICFRDEYSYNLFKDSLKNVSLAPDIAFQFKYPTENIMDKGYALISVIDLTNRETISKHKEKYQELLLFYIRKYINDGLRIILFSACHSENDTFAIKNIISKLSLEEQSKIEIRIHNNLEESIKLISESSMVMSTRLHVTILSLLFNKRTLPLVYDDKAMNILSDIGFNNHFIDIRKIESIEDICNNIPLQFNISETIRKNSEKQFEYLDSILLVDD